MFSKAAASAPSPEPFAIARSMLSFGIEYDFAFSIAFASVALLAGSPPPSFAATMIARVSFEKSLPRLASAAPFLCLIEDHLLCPDTHRLLDGIQEQLVHPRIFRQLGVKRRNDDSPVTHEHRLALVLGENLYVSGHANARRADEDTPQRGAVALEQEIGLEARDLPPVRVPVD